MIKSGRSLSREGPKVAQKWVISDPSKTTFLIRITYKNDIFAFILFSLKSFEYFCKKLKKMKKLKQVILSHFYRANMILKGSRVVTKQVIFDQKWSPPKNQRNHVTFIKLIKNSIFFTFFHFFSLFFTFFEKK